MEENGSVFGLLTDLCSHISNEYCTEPRISRKKLTKKMRARAYEIILNKSDISVPSSEGDPGSDLLSYYFVAQHSVRNVAEYKSSAELKRIIGKIRSGCFQNSDMLFPVLKCLLALKDTVPNNASNEMFQHPFTLGLLDKMLPRPEQTKFSSAQPYQYYPDHVFDLPYSIHREHDSDKKTTSSTKYGVFTEKSFCLRPDIESSNKSHIHKQDTANPELFRINSMSMESMSTTSVSSYKCNTFNFGRLEGPRDLQIPSSQNNVKVELAESSSQSDIKETHTANQEILESILDIWQYASAAEKNIPDDIWELASKMPAVEERRLIAMSPREINIWRQVYGDRYNQLHIVSEKLFIRHLMYLTIGIESSSFILDKQTNTFFMKSNLTLEGVSKECIAGYVANILCVGTCYRRLYIYAFNQSIEEHFYGSGVVFEAAREAVKQYLLDYQLKATKLFDKCMGNECGETEHCFMPTLLQILHHLEPLKYEIETLAAIYKLIDADQNATIPKGVELMSYMYNEISMITHKNTAFTLYKSLHNICKVYFKFIERFIFEGELDDRQFEFFIRKDLLYVNSHSKRYWDKGFYIADNGAIPAFLKGLAKYILLCGKSLRLLKQCNPSDPLVLLISSNHPTVKCCTSFEDLDQQQQVLDVYRTRCLFVSGEPATFEQILLRREAQKKAFTEMASMKQAETLEKIMAERRRLARLIMEEKQHSVRILEAAIAENLAAKSKMKMREKLRNKLEEAVEKARDDTDALIKEDEKNKIIEYYSKLNMEVEKRKVHTEWKIKRLQLDESRMQLISSEERNFKREKLELEHSKSEDSMANSMYSTVSGDSNMDVDQKSYDVQSNTAAIQSNTEVIDSNPSEILTIPSNTDQIESNETYFKDGLQPQNKTSDDSGLKQREPVLSIICKVAKSIFGDSSKDSKDNIDNMQAVDSQGNIVEAVEILNENVSSDDIIKIIYTDSETQSTDNEIDNSEFIKTRLEALSNKQKVMAHEFGQVDSENNIRDRFIDIDNNIKLTEYRSAISTTAFEEAKRNKLKVLGNDFDDKDTNKPYEAYTDAQKEAVINRHKVLGTEYNLGPKLYSVKEPLNKAQCEAAENKKKMLGSEYGTAVSKDGDVDYHDSKIKYENVKSDSQDSKKEIKHGKNASGDYKIDELRDCKKDSSVGKLEFQDGKFDSPRRAALTLNLKSPIQRDKETLLSLESGKESSVLTPNTAGLTTGGITPGDFFPRLDLETPTTAEVPSGVLTEPITPHETKTFGTPRRSHTDFLTNDGFKFPHMVTEEESDDLQSFSEANTPEKSLDTLTDNLDTFKSKILNAETDNTFANFDPFGVKNCTLDTKDFLSKKMSLEISKSFYTDPAEIMREAAKKPYKDIFSPKSLENEEKPIIFDNIATLTVCLQRSVMLPLSYQLEIVNNSILTHYLVNLDMYEHLRSLKDYFFLMDGEFSRSICNNLFAKLVTTINPEELLNYATLHSILDKALGSSISHQNKFSENLSFTITEPPLSFHHSSPDVLQCLSLTYSVNWPMNIILSGEALVRYAKVFQFLVKMRRISWVLGQDFEVLKLSVKLSREKSRKLLKSPQYTAVQIHRHTMASLVRALDNYIVTTCLQSSWTEFEDDLKRARTLDDLYDCHVVYIKKVLFRCLLNKRSTPVMKLLNDVFTVILKFSRVLRAREWNLLASGIFIHPNFSQLEELFLVFEKLTKYLHKTITRLMECGYQPHLTELLTMINLNDYYEPDKSTDLNSTQSSQTPRTPG